MLSKINYTQGGIILPFKGATATTPLFLDSSIRWFFDKIVTTMSTFKSSFLLDNVLKIGFNWPVQSIESGTGQWSNPKSFKNQNF